MVQVPFIVLDRASIVRAGEDVFFRDLSWAIHEGQTWAIVGPVGSGKTTLAEALTGKLHAQGITWPFIERVYASGSAAVWPSQLIQIVSFKEESRRFSYARHYYQQRFNFIEANDDLTLDAFLHLGGAIDEYARCSVCERLGIDHLRGLSLIKLSNGQTRRARIARALLHRPEFLILDEPFMGLDAAGRSEVTAILGKLCQDGMRMILITRPEAIPGWVTHVLELERLAIRWQGTRTAFAERHGERGDARDQRDLTLSTTDASPLARPIVELSHVHVAYDGISILNDVSWTVCEGERWALLGPNGSGKTTLLSLIAADHPQAYSNDIRLFGQQRGSGESIWDIKRRIGLVSPEMHLYFSEPLSAFRAAATGFFDVLAYRATSPEHDAHLRELFEFFELTALADRPFGRLSTGQQRLVLIIRALVKSPRLLILDEPFQGLDGMMVARLRHWLDEKLRPEQALIFVTHLPEEIPSSVNRALRLNDGRVV